MPLFLKNLFASTNEKTPENLTFLPCGENHSLLHENSPIQELHPFLSTKVTFHIYCIM